MKVFITGIIIGLFSFNYSQGQTVNTTGPHYLMAAMGDSITAGFLAATDLSWFNSSTNNYKADINSFENNLEANYGRNPETLNLTGDLAHIFESRTTYSWATGKLI